MTQEERQEQERQYYQQCEMEEYYKSMELEQAVDDAKALLINNGFIVLPLHEVISEYCNVNKLQLAPMPEQTLDPDEIPF